MLCPPSYPPSTLALKTTNLAPSAPETTVFLELALFIGTYKLYDAALLERGSARGARMSLCKLGSA